MKKLIIMLFLWLFLSSSLLAGCPQQQKKPEGQRIGSLPPDTVIAVKTEKPPEIDGEAEGVWQKSQALSTSLIGAGDLQAGRGGKFGDGKTEVKIQALYDNSNLYLLLNWSDPSKSLARGPWIKEKGKLVLKSYREFNEDKLAILWNINNSVKNFNTKGCMSTCHATDFKTQAGTTIKKHFTNGKEELADLWYWRVSEHNTLLGKERAGLMHDQYLDNAEYDPEIPGKNGAGRHSDPGGREYKANANEQRTEPLKVFEGEPINGNSYVIVDGLDKTKDFDPRMIADMKEGDHIPGFIAYQIGDDQADIYAKARYNNGKWTLEIKRSLKTQSEQDVQFDDLQKEYLFGIAAFDNSQIGHAYQRGVNKLLFK